MTASAAPVVSPTRVGPLLGYVMNRMGPHIADDPRKMALVDALYSAL